MHDSANNNAQVGVSIGEYLFDSSWYIFPPVGGAINKQSSVLKLSRHKNKYS
jgi:hypothetical protein